MTPAPVTTWPACGHRLLERAVSYAAGAVHGITPELLSRPTPCQGWDLRMLLWHVNESLAALHEGITAGSVALSPAPGDDPAADPVPTFHDRASRLLTASADADSRHLITIADRPITLTIMTATAALEIAVHGWDISQARGHHRPIPHALAVDLLELSPLLVPRTIRHPLFAAPVPVALTASPSDRLTAFLGRTSQITRKTAP